jgi:protein CpxP
MRDKWRQIGIGAGLALLVAAAAPMVSAQNTNGAPPPFMGRGMRGGPPPGGPAGLPLGRLGLSDAQRDQVRSIMEGHRDEQQALGDRLRQAHDALEQAMQSGTFDEGAVRQAAMALADVETDGAVLRARIFSEVFQILTPDQQSQLKDLEARRDARSGPRGRGPRGQRPNGGGNVGP